MGGRWGNPLRLPAALTPYRSRIAEPAADPKPRTAKAEGAVELLRLAVSAHQQAMSDSACAPPSPGYVGRIRAVADSCEHLAATMINAAETVGDPLEAEDRSSGGSAV